MVAGERLLLPLHDFLTALQAWRADRSDTRHESLRTSFERLATSYRAAGAFLAVEVSPIGPLSLGVGSLREMTAVNATNASSAHDLAVGHDRLTAASMWIDGADAHEEQLAEAVELALNAIWAQSETVIQRQQLEALDAAVRGIAGIMAVDQVLQVIVDRVRDLIGAHYAALGIVGQFGRIEQFIVSGISAEQRALLGPPPQGHGLLGLIIREDRPLMIEDINRDPRRHGFPPHHPEMRSLLGVPVRSRTSTIGNLYLTDKVGAAVFSEDDLRLVEKFALHAGIAIENARLHEEIGRLAIVDERQRISQDLHDSVIQSLYAISLSLEDLPDVMAEDAREGTARTDRAIDSIHAAIRDIRNFIMGLQPELLDETDLASGVRSLAAELAANTMIDFEVHMNEESPDLGRDRSAHVLAITREALSNLARHSDATRGSLELTGTDTMMRLVISDNGRGFDVDEVRGGRQRGLVNLRARADALGAILIIDSEQGVGTRVELDIPVSNPTKAWETSDEALEKR